MIYDIFLCKPHWSISLVAKIFDKKLRLVPGSPQFMVIRNELTEFGPDHVWGVF